MEMAVLVEPTATGFKATSLTVADLHAEAGTEQEALQAIRRRLEDRIGANGKIVHLPVHDSVFLEAWDRLSRSTDWDDFNEILREQRKKSDAQDSLAIASEDGTV